MRKSTALALALTTATLSGLVASAPASADTTKVSCGVPSYTTDYRVGQIVSTTYRLPAGNTVTVTRQTDPMTAAYAAARGTLVQVCMPTAPPMRTSR